MPGTMLFSLHALSYLVLMALCEVSTVIVPALGN